MLLDKIKKTIEALLFMKGEEGLSVEFFSTFMEVEYHEAENMLNIFLEEYNLRDNPLIIKKFGMTYKMLLNEEMSEMIKKAIVSLETLAIVAYNQPITKVQIDKIRGVSSDSILHSLISKELIVSTKTLDTIGKPKLYETTEMFLDVFGIESLDELPKSDDISESEISKFLEK